MDYPYDCLEYRTKNRIPIEGALNLSDLPTLNMRNSVVMEIWNRKQALEGISVFDVLKLMDLKLNKLEMYWLVKKIIAIKNIQEKWNKKEADKRREQLEALGKRGIRT